MTHETAIAYLKVLLSTQMVAGILVGLFIVTFKSGLHSLMGRVASIRWGSAEVSVPQSQATDTPPAAAALSRDEEIIDAAVATIEQADGLTPEAQQQLQDALAAERDRARIWEYKYLDLFFVPRTKQVLEWLSRVSTPLHKDAFDQIWGPQVPVEKERKAIIDALAWHAMVSIVENTVSITPRGLDYLKHRGVLKTDAADIFKSQDPQDSAAQWSAPRLTP